MSASLISRNVVIAGQRTSFRLEPEMWSALEDICNQEKTDIHTLCTWIANYKPRANRTSAIRAFIVTYLREIIDDNSESYPRIEASNDNNAMSPKLCHLFGVQ